MRRSTLSLLNSSLSIGTMIITYIFSFVYRTVLVKVMGAEYVGITGLCCNVIGLFSMAELGVGWAIGYYLYQPLQQNNREEVAAIINYLRKLYVYIGVFIAVAGIATLPFLDVIIKSDRPIEHLHIIFLLFLLNTVLSYWFFAHYGILIGADRKNYKVFLPKTIVPTVCTLTQILIIYFMHNFLLAVVMLSVSSITSNLWIAWVGRKEYAYLREFSKVKLTSELKTKVVKYIKATMIYKVSLTVQQSITSIVISSFIGVAVLGIYSNFLLIVDTVKGVILNMIHPMTAIIGEINVAESVEYKVTIFKRLNFLMEGIITICATCFFVLMNPFVELWLGDEFTLPQTTMFLIVTFFYLEFITSFSTKFRDACGLNNVGKFRPLATAVLNVVFAFSMVGSLGLNGVLLAMSLSRLLTITWFEPWVVYSHVFGESVLKYYVEVLIHVLLTVIVAGFTYMLVGYIWNESWLTFVVSTIIAVIIPTVAIVICYGRSEAFKYYLTFVKEKNNKKK